MRLVFLSVLIGGLAYRGCVTVMEVHPLKVRGPTQSPALQPRHILCNVQRTGFCLRQTLSRLLLFFSSNHVLLPAPPLCNHTLRWLHLISQVRRVSSDPGLPRSRVSWTLRAAGAEHSEVKLTTNIDFIKSIKKAR